MRLTKKELARRIALETDDTKYCSRCGQVKLLYEFSTSGKCRKMAYCYCLSYESEIKYKQKYDITHNEFKELLKLQDGKCAICGTNIPGGQYNVFSVDHDHDSKIKNKRDSVRGLLCDSCNRGIGFLKDDPEILMAAAGYLLKWRTKKEKKCTLKTGEKNEEN